MNPHQANKVDISSLSPDEQRLLRLYGKVPTKKDLLQNKLKERKYFDSGDYALSKAGKASDVGVTNIGSRHPVPENIPHLTATSPGANIPVPIPAATTTTTGGGGGAAASNGNNGGIPGIGISAQSIPGSLSGHPGSIGFQSRNSPAKEGGFVQRKSSLNHNHSGDGGAAEDEDGRGRLVNNGGDGDDDISPPPAREGVPIRQ